MKARYFNYINIKWNYGISVFIVLTIFFTLTGCVDKQQSKLNKNIISKKGVPYKMKDNYSIPSKFLKKDWDKFHKKNNLKMSSSDPSSSQWESVDFTIDHDAGSYGAHGVGVLRSISIDPSNSNRVIAGSILAGLWLTTDKGTNWSAVGSDVPLVEAVWDIEFARSNPSIVYAITNAGLIKSTDAGVTWKYATNFLSTLSYTAREMMLDVSTTNSNKVYVSIKGSTQGLNGGIYLTENGGNSWKTQQEGSFWDVKIKPGDDSVVYAVKRKNTDWVSFLRSTDSGKTFTEISNGYPAERISGRELYRGAIAVSSAAPDYVYLYCAGDNEYGFWKSTDGGVSFTKKDQGWPGDTDLSVVPTGIDFTFDNKLTAGYGQTTWDFAVAVSSTNPEIVYAGCNKTMYSTNGGETWAHMGNPDQKTWPIHGDIQGIDAFEDEVWVVSDGGAYYSSDNGVRAVSKYDGIYTQECWGFSQGFKTDIMAAGINHNAVYIRDDALYNTKWLTGPGADSQTATVNPLDDRFIYATPWWDVRLKRPTARNTAPISSENLGVYAGYINFQNYIVHPNLYYKIFVVGHSQPQRPELVKGVAVSEDNASSWSALKEFSNISSRGGRMQISFADPNTMFSIIKRNNRGYQLWKTNDGGTVWTDVTPSLESILGFTMKNIALSEKDTNIAWMILGTSNNVKVIKTIDGGLSWTDYSEGLPNVQGSFGIVNQRGTDGGVYIGTRMGVYYRNASMNSWELHGTGILGGEINFLQINYAKGKIRMAGTRSVWENNLYESFDPDANFAADKNYLTETLGSMSVKFKDHSAITQSGASWSWSFPGGTPATSKDENPVVSYENADSGKYDVSLVVTDSEGKKSTKTITNFIEVKRVAAGSCSLLIPNEEYSIHDFDSQETTGENAPVSLVIDGDASTIWSTQWTTPTAELPHHVSIDLSKTYNIVEVNYTPRQNQENGRIKTYKIESSLDGNTWKEVASGDFPNTKEIQKIVLSSSTQARYMKLTALSEVNGNPWTSVGELSFVGCKLKTVDLTTPEEGQENINVFPNPVEGILTIQHSKLLSNNTKISLASLDGKEIKNIYWDSNKNEILLNLKGLSKGIYLLSLTDDESGVKYSRKIIKK